MAVLIKSGNSLVPVNVSANIVDGTDVSDTTATASDVASGKYFYTAAGVKTEGTASGGGGATVTVTLSIGNSGMLDNSGYVYYLDGTETYQTGTFEMDENYNFIWSGNVLENSLLFWEEHTVNTIQAFQKYPGATNATLKSNIEINTGGRPSGYIYYAVYQVSSAS